MEKILQVENLKKNYGENMAVSGINFDVYGGEIFALIGPNGAGKSTTLKMIATILTPTSGKISIAGFDTRKNDKFVREKISYLPEEAGGYKKFSGIEYLNFMAGLYEDDDKKHNEMVKYAKNISKLGNRLNDKITTYSKGMLRKLLLSRTIMTSPKLAILDEPTSGLDVLNAIGIRDQIKKCAKNGMAVLLSSHNMLEIEYLAQKVAIIDKGVIIEQGDVQTLKKKHNAKNLEEVFIKVAK